MALQGDPYFGFDLIQRKTLIRLLQPLLDLPTEDPEVEGEIWNDEGVLKVSAG